MSQSALQQICTRVGAARLLLTEHEGKRTHVTVSKIQTAAVISLLAATTLTPDEQVEALEKIALVPWADGDLDAILTSLSLGGSSAPLQSDAVIRKIIRTFTTTSRSSNGRAWKVLPPAKQSSP